MIVFDIEVDGGAEISIYDQKSDPPITSRISLTSGQVDLIESYLINFLNHSSNILSTSAAEGSLSIKEFEHTL